MDSFSQFLQSKQQEEKIAQSTRQERLKNWTKSIDDFYAVIKKWLSPFHQQSLLSIEEKEISKTEEYIGQYVTKRLDIRIGNDVISLTPIGTYILGSYGRIDMRGPKAEMIIVERDWNKWEFIQRTPKRETWQVSEESFKTAIESIING